MPLHRRLAVPLALSLSLSLSLVSLPTRLPAESKAAQTAAEPAANAWQPLCAGSSFAGWTTKTGQPVSTGWSLQDGVIHRHSAGGDIVTTTEWADFELEFEWKTAAGANSGVKYRVGDYLPAGRSIGPEYQVLDDAGHPNGQDPKTSAGSLYDLVPATTSKKVRPVGEWNQSRIIARGQLLEHWLNGEKIMEVDLASAAWKSALAASKFKTAPDFATRKGRLLLQDHGDEVWFRALRIRELPSS
jgi:hypothetical protein